MFKKYRRIFLFGLAVSFSLPLFFVSSEPLFQLNFEEGLTPESGQPVDVKWNGQSEPQYSPFGLRGRALILGDLDNAGNEPRGAVPSVAYTLAEEPGSSGTVLFWCRGLDNWDIYQTVYNDPEAANTLFLSTGAIWLYKWIYDTSGPKLYAHYHHKSGHRQMFYSSRPLDYYRWFQKGFTWEEDVVRLYRNGVLVNEQRGWKEWIPIMGRTFSLGGGQAKQGSRRLLDNVKIWDRALTESEVKREYRQGLNRANSPMVSATRLKNVPVIDGIVESGEWARASMLTGLLESESGEIAVDQSSFYIGYDDDFLYIAMQGDLTEQARERPVEVMHIFLNYDGDLASDDKVELVLSPRYRQSCTEGMGEWKEYPLAWFGNRRTFFQQENLGDWREYIFAANFTGDLFNAVYGAGGRDDSPSADWETASSVSESGWQFEARIPFSLVGVSPVAGEQWGMQLGRVWKHLKEEYNLWSWGLREVDYSEELPEWAGSEFPAPGGVDRGSYVNREYGRPDSALGTIRFASADEPFVRLRQTGLLQEGQVDWHAELHNPSKDGDELFVEIFTDTDEIWHKEVLDIPGNGHKDFRIEHKIEDYSTSRITFMVSDKNGTVIHRTELPFYLKQTFSARVRGLPYYDKFLVELGMGVFSGIPLEELAVDLRLADSDGNTVYSIPDVRPEGYICVIEGDSSGVAYGTYGLFIDIRRREEIIASKELEFTRHEKAPWHDNRHGYGDVETDTVPYPWTEMRVDGDTLHVWGREYRYGRGILPEQVSTLGYDIFDAPVKIFLKKTDGKIFEFSTENAENRWISIADTRVEGSRKILQDGLILHNNFWAEYDGLVWNTLRLEQCKAAGIVSLEIEISLNRAFSDVIKSGRNIGRLSPGGYSGLSSVWMGNGDGGIQFLPETGSIDIEDRGQGAIIRYIVPIIFEDESDPYEFSFGFNATPTRPRTWRTPEYPDYRGRGAAWGGGAAWYPPGYVMKPAADTGSASTNVLYVFTQVMNTVDDASGIKEYTKYGAEWTPDPLILPQESGYIYPDFSLRPLRDYFVWRYWRYREEYGIKGLYYDNPHGRSLDKRDLVKRLYNITLATPGLDPRDADMGIAANGAYNMSYGGFFTYEWNGEQYNSIVTPGRHYMDVFDPGTFRAEQMGHNWGWPARFLGQGRIKPSAVEAAGGIERLDGHFMGLSFLHDTMKANRKWTNFMPCCMWPAPFSGITGRSLEAMEKYGFSHWVYQFMPYWQQDIVSMPLKDISVSFYTAYPSRILKAIDEGDDAAIDKYFDSGIKRHLPAYIKESIREDVRASREELSVMKDRVIMIVYNDSGSEGIVRLNPDWEKIGLGESGSLSAVNAVHSRGFMLETVMDADGNKAEKGVFFDRPEEYALIESDELVFPITAYDYRMIVLEPKQNN